MIITFRATKSIPKVASVRSMFALVRTAVNGNRATIDNEVIQMIGATDYVQVALTDKGVAFGCNLPADYVAFPLRKSGNKGVIYSKELVAELTSLFNLDFTAKTSISFVDVSYTTLEDQPIALFNLATPLAETSQADALATSDEN